jgi:hypothetical protein
MPSVGHPGAGGGSSASSTSTRFVIDVPVRGVETTCGSSNAPSPRLSASSAAAARDGSPRTI